MTELFGGATALLLGGFLWSGSKRRRPTKHEGVHGTARFQTEADIRRSGLLPRDTRRTARRRLCRRLDRSAGPHPLPAPRRPGAMHRHRADPQRQGRGRHPADAAVLARQRRHLRREGRAVGADRRLARSSTPTTPSSAWSSAPSQGSAGFNFLEEVRLGTPHEVADAQNIAQMLCDPNGEGLSRITGRRPASPCSPA